VPIFRFDKVIGMARNMKAFLNPKSGSAHGAAPNVEQHKNQAQALRDALQHISAQKRKLKRQRLEIFQLREELRAAKEQAAGNEPVTRALPDFVIVGANKCGTTSLYHLLAQHPYVEPAASKELQFFDEFFDLGVEWYRRCFPSPRWEDGRRTITGEATPSYLFHPHAAKRMAEVVPHAQLIALLRNPVDRAYSHYNQVVRRGFEPLRFEEAIEAEEARLRGERDRMLEDERYFSDDHRSFSYLSTGIYVEHLQRWAKFFPREQMLVLKSEDFFDNPKQTLKLAFDFLDLPDWEPKAYEVRKKGTYEEGMEPATRRRLEEYFEPHNRRLYDYLGTDFGW
jgi:hypothetical protein